MLKNKITYIKAGRIISKLFFILLILIFLIKLITIGSTNHSKERQLESLKKNLNCQLKENEELKEQIDSGIKKEYVEKIARDKLNMAYPNERSFVEISKG